MNLIMFDIDGTLVESTAFDAECYKDAVENELNISISDDWAIYKNVTDSGVLQEILDTNNIQTHIDDIIQPIKQHFFSSIQKHLSSSGLSEIRGAKKYMNSVKEFENTALSIATGGWRKSAEMKLHAAGFDFSNIPLATSDDHHTRIGIMQQAAKKTGRSEFSNRIYFGDGIWDKKACEELGYKFIAIGNKVEHEVRFEDFESVNISI